jgi:hypothetical protein
MTRVNAAALAAAIAAMAALAAACSAMEPFATAPKAAKAALPGRAAPAVRVAICYNHLRTSRDEARAQAQQQCAKGTVAELVASDDYLQVCPILLPTHATFACVPAAGAAAAAGK